MIKISIFAVVSLLAAFAVVLILSAVTAYAYQDPQNSFKDGGAHVAWFHVDKSLYVCIGDGCVEVPTEIICKASQDVGNE